MAGARSTTGHTTGGRILGALLALLLVIPLGLVTVHPAEAADPTSITIAGREVDRNGTVLGRFVNGVAVELGAIRQTSFVATEGAGVCFTEDKSARTRCLYRMTFVEGKDSSGNTFRVQIASISWRDGKVVLTPAPDVNFPNQDKVEMVMTPDEAKSKVVAEFLPTSEFIAIEYDLSGADGLESFDGTGFVTSTRQIITRPSSGASTVKAALNVAYGRTEDLEFTNTASSPASTDLTVTSSVERDTSVSTETRQALTVELTNASSVAEVQVKVSSIAKASETFTATAEARPVDGLNRLYTAPAVTTVNRSQSTLRWGGTLQVDVTQETVKPASLAANYFVSQIVLNKQGINVPLPSQWTQKYATRAEWEAAYTAWRQEYVGKTLIDREITSGANAGVRVQVILKDARVLADTHALGDDTSAGPTGITDDVANDEPHYWGHQHAYLWRTAYTVKIIGLVNKKTEVGIQYTPTSNTVIQNLSSYGFVSKAGLDNAISIWSQMAVGDTVYPHAWRNLCMSSADGDCPWVGAKFLDGNESGHVGYYKTALIWRNGYGAPYFTAEDESCPNGEAFADEQGEQVCRGFGVEVVSHDDPYPTMWATVNGVLTPVPLVRRSSANEMWAWVPKQADRTINVVSDYQTDTLGTSRAQSLMALSSPFTFDVTQKESTAADAKSLADTTDQKNLNVRDHFIFAVDTAIPDLGDTTPFIGYNLFACSTTTCYPVYANTTGKPLKTCKASTTYTTTADDLKPDEKKALHLFFPGDTVNLDEWNICWQENTGEQLINELRFVPAADTTAASLSALAYHAESVTVIDGRNRTNVEFRFKSVPGVTVRFADSWWEDDANISREVATAAGDITVTRDEADTRTTREAVTPTSATAAALRVVFTPAATTGKVNIDWTVNGEAVDEPPAGSTATLTLDGTAATFGADLTGHKAGDVLTVAVSTTSLCEVASTTITGPTLTDTPGVNAAKNESADIALGEQASANVWTVTNALTCPKATLTLVKTFTKFTGDGAITPDPKDWTLGVKEQGAAGEPTTVESEDSVELDAGTYTLSEARVQPPSTDLSAFIDATKWTCAVVEDAAPAGEASGTGTSDTGTSGSSGTDATGTSGTSTSGTSGTGTAETGTATTPAAGSAGGTSTEVTTTDASAPATVTLAENGRDLTIPVGVTNVRCELHSTVGQLTVITRVHSSSGATSDQPTAAPASATTDLGAAVRAGAGNTRAAAASTHPSVSAMGNAAGSSALLRPLLMAEAGASLVPASALAAPTVGAVVWPAAAASEWTVTATPDADSLAAGALPVTFTNSTATGGMGVSTHFVRPGSTYTLSAEGPTGMWVTARERYIGTEPFEIAMASLDDPTLWQPMDEAAVTVPADPTEREIVRLTTDEIPVPVLPLTGGTGRDLYLLAGAGGFLMAALAAAAVWRRHRVA